MKTSPLILVCYALVVFTFASCTDPPERPTTAEALAKMDPELATKRDRFPPISEVETRYVTVKIDGCEYLIANPGFYGWSPEMTLVHKGNCKGCSNVLPL
jgi:hypothetical protein